MIEIVPATLAHTDDLAPRLRALELAEIEAASRCPVGEVLAESLEACGNDASNVIALPVTGLTNTSAFVDFSVSYEIA